MVAVITSVLAGSAVALLAAAVSGHSLFYALVFGVPAGVASLAGLMRAQHRTWTRARGEVMFVEEVPEGATHVHWHAHAGTPGPSLETSFAPIALAPRQPWPRWPAPGSAYPASTAASSRGWSEKTSWSDASSTGSTPRRAAISRCVAGGRMLSSVQRM